MISLGAGVQSSTLLLMAAEGLIDPTPVVAIFADTQGEPADVYSWLGYLKRTAGERVPIYGHTAGDLRRDILNAVAEGNSSLPTPPLYLINPDGSHGFSQRKCTRDYKVRVVGRKLRELGFGPKRPVEQWIGISTDEVERMKPSGNQWQKNRWPLIEMGMSRHDCEIWLREHNHPTAPKSACFYCPYQSNARWRALRDEHPDEWAIAVEFDAATRRTPGLNGECFLHRQRVPLDQVDLSTPEDRGQLTFASECEGMCGV